MTAGATMNLAPEQSKYLVALVPGEAAACTDRMDYPVLARIPGGAARETGIPALAAPPTGIIAPRSVEAIVSMMERNFFELRGRWAPPGSPAARWREGISTFERRASGSFGAIRDRASVKESRSTPVKASKTWCRTLARCPGNVASS